MMFASWDSPPRQANGVIHEAAAYRVFECWRKQTRAYVWVRIEIPDRSANIAGLLGRFRMMVPQAQAKGHGVKHQPRQWDPSAETDLSSITRASTSGPDAAH
jgi:hypothetical protein